MLIGSVLVHSLLQHISFLVGRIWNVIGCLLKVDSPEEGRMPCMLLLPVQDRGCEVKQATAHFQTLPRKWLIALVWLLITRRSALGLLADGDGINSCPWGVSGTRRPAGPVSCYASMGAAPSYLVLFLLQPGNVPFQRPVGLASL